MGSSKQVVRRERLTSSIEYSAQAERRWRSGGDSTETRRCSLWARGSVLWGLRFAAQCAALVGATASSGRCRRVLACTRAACRRRGGVSSWRASRTGQCDFADRTQLDASN